MFGTTKPANIATVSSAAMLALMLSAAGAQAASLAKTFAPKGQATLDHSDFSSLLAKHVKRGRSGVNLVNYRGVKRDRTALSAYIKRMEGVNVPSLSSNAAKAYWINLYNAKTLEIVADHHPVSSIRKISLGGVFSRGPWKKDVVTVGGKKLSLDDIEHEIARKTWRDPRLHYGFNCASIGCPDLGKTAFTGAKINAQLDQAARAYINHPRGVSVKGGKVTASKIYDWYASDFGNDKQLKAHWKKYANKQLSDALTKNPTISSYAYDWSLNDAR